MATSKDLLPPYEDWVDARLGNVIVEAEKLRFGVSAGSPADSLTEVHDALVHVRANQDRIEELLATLLRAQADVRREVIDRRSVVDDKWDQQATRKSVGFGFDDAAPRERYAQYNQAIIDDRRALRRAEKLQGQVDLAVELLKLFHKGLEGVRWTLNTRLTAMSTATRLER